MGDTQGFYDSIRYQYFFVYTDIDINTDTILFKLYLHCTVLIQDFVVLQVVVSQD